MALRVLIVNGRSAEVQSQQRLLHGLFQDGVITLVCATLQDALAVTEPVDVVLLDLSLPDSIAEQTIEAVRREAFRAPVIVITDESEAALGAVAVRAGAQDYLAKPELASPDVSEATLGRSIRYARERHLLVGELTRTRDELEARRVELEALLELARNDLSTQLQHIGERCDELARRAERTAEGSRTWLYDAARSAASARRLIANLAGELAMPGRLPGSRLRSLYETLADEDVWPAELLVAVDLIPAELQRCRAAIPEPTLVRAISLVIRLFDGTKALLRPRVEDGQLVLSVAIHLAGPAKEVPEIGGLDVLRELMSFEIAAGWRIVSSMVERFGGTVGVELRTIDEVALTLRSPLRELAVAYGGVLGASLQPPVL